ncbi:MAG: 3-isopropylmalate dehydrogenase [Clostridiales bacterium]|jgi:3-isopropylmalate dehydrogenase|nr:3-isopropylmalate dehydrogenase [Clostridiales bacterium]
MKLKIALVKGDGIGPEVVSAAALVLDRTAGIYGHEVVYEEVLAGGAAIDEAGEPLPEASVDACRRCGAVLLGAVGGPKWDTLPPALRPERAILGLRKELGLYANLRPVKLNPETASGSPLRADIAQKGIDLIFMRELTGGVYFGERGRTTTPVEAAFDTERYSAPEVERIGRRAFEAARGRRKKVTSVDKANVLETSRLWREVMHRLCDEYPDIEYADMLVDNASMQLIIDPGQFDVIVTSNLFGDILSDEAAALTGSIGLIPSASLGDGSFGLYEPIHGSAPDIAGRGIANPTAAVLSAAMMLRYSFSLPREAECIEKAVLAAQVGAAGHMTGGGNGTNEITERILDNIR